MFSVGELLTCSWCGTQHTLAAPIRVPAGVVVLMPSLERVLLPTAGVVYADADRWTYDAMLCVYRCPDHPLVQFPGRPSGHIAGQVQITDDPATVPGIVRENDA